jgi:hypothetical protein
VSPLLEKFYEEVRSGLLRYEVTLSLQKLSEATPEARWLIVSGAGQAELREALDQRGIFIIFTSASMEVPRTNTVSFRACWTQDEFISPHCLLAIVV